MDSTELERRARLRYEVRRAIRAFLAAMPLLVVALSAAWVGGHPDSTLAFGGILFTLGALVLWYGREPLRAFVPGVVWGFVPLAAALVANHFRACGIDHCGTYCVPACCVGGVVAGLAIADLGRRHRRGAAFWASASAFVFLTGAMGCACVGFSGVVGLVGGYVLGALPGFVVRYARPTPG